MSCLFARGPPCSNLDAVLTVSLSEPRLPPMSQPASLATARPRRTQEERSAETRARLLDATIESLVEVGYASTTTTLVCERAGVSRGAQVHHFPRKQDLVVAAVAHLAAQHAADLRRGPRRCRSTGADRLGAVCSTRRPTPSTARSSTAALELWIAARTDAELHRSLIPFERGAGRGLVPLWREIAGDLGSSTRVSTRCSAHHAPGARHGAPEDPAQR